MFRFYPTVCLFLLFSWFIIPQNSWAQKNSKNKNNSTILPAIDPPKSVAPKRIRWDKLTFDTTDKNCPSKLGYAYLDGVKYSGGFFNTFPKKDASDKPITSKEGSMKNGLLDGEYFEYSKQGIKQVFETYSEGKKNGKFSYYYEDGFLEIMGNFKNGELDGEVTGYYHNGIKKYANHYTNGNRNGTCFSYFENGQVEQESEFVNEIPDGDVIGYFPNGTVRNIKTFDTGYLEGRSYVFHRNGCPAIEEYYKHGKLDSIQRAFDFLSCNIISSGYWKLGKKEGAFVTYDMFGDTLTLTTFKDSLRHGLHRIYKEVWDESGKKYELKIETEGNFVNEAPNGFWKYGQVSNFQRREGNYDLGVKIGEWTYYDKEGKLLLKQWFDNGELTKQKFY